MAKHTPGQWVVNPVSAIVDDAKGNPICKLLWPTEVRSEDETEANARLISSAPALLHVLKRAINDIRCGALEPDDFPWLKDAEAICAKAESL